MTCKMTRMSAVLPALAAVLFAAMGMAVAALAAAPDDPSAPVPSARYSPVLHGAKPFRPVEPKPWGAINERVMPKAAPKRGAPAEKKQ